MMVFRICIVACALGILAGCDPVTGASRTAPHGASQADYERHKANREAYMYQGL